jgi:hypothetical protein
MRLLFGLMALVASGVAYGGMPVVTLSDTAELRLSGISFFLLTILLVAWGVRALWNLLRRDFPRVPFLDYKRSVALVVLLGLCFNVVLLMIAGTRELMTPGAWEKNGTTYQLKAQPRER